MGSKNNCARSPPPALNAGRARILGQLRCHHHHQSRTTEIFPLRGEVSRPPLSVSALLDGTAAGYKFPPLSRFPPTTTCSPDLTPVAACLPNPQDQNIQKPDELATTGVLAKIVNAVNEVCAERREMLQKENAGNFDVHTLNNGMHSEISVSDLDRHMYSTGCPDPDIVIRTSGET
ncbi:hypothetical protein PR202_gb10553 [Eleusine coracana subsp. coracana]|uniref:Uncharacterized protein n=1 Tax=Eleusine coracana subsp. coracana TaxID=191504 RepID=A0AAV5EKS0_ELECO|nr:hypothetical protein PR202_gb10553 [Eleusine coracana subsp. coracana]